MLLLYSILLASLSESSTVGSNPKSLSRAVFDALPFLTREMQIKTILYHSVHFDSISVNILPASIDEFLHDLVVFNAPELDEALHVRLDMIVSAIENVALNYITCRESPYCKYLPRGLRNADGAEYARTVIGEYMNPDGKLPDEETLSKKICFAYTCFLDEFSGWRAYMSARVILNVLAQADKSIIIINQRKSNIVINLLKRGAFALIPSARMLTRLNGESVELWYADSREPEVLYNGPGDVSIEVEISPDHTMIMIYVTVTYETEENRLTIGKVFRTNYKHKTPVFEFNSDRLVNDIMSLGGAPPFHYYNRYSLDWDIFRPLDVRNAELLATFKEQVERIPFNAAAEMTPQQEKLGRIYAAITAPDDILLRLIKDFLRGRAYQASSTQAAQGGREAAIRTLIRNTIAGDRPMYQLSAQEFWEASFKT